MPRTHPGPLLLTIALLVGACAAAPTGSITSPGTTSPDRSAAPTSADQAPPTASGGPAPASGRPTGASATPAASPVDAVVPLTQAWATAPLTDVSTGQTFRIADLAGKVVIIETMAIWCSNCRAQQADVQEALARLPAASVVFVVLDVDPNEDAASLAEYRASNGFEGRYAIAGGDVARAIAADYGDQMLNPPSTPMLIIGTDGKVTLTEFGHKSADEIVTLAQTHGA